MMPNASLDLETDAQNYRADSNDIVIEDNVYHQACIATYNDLTSELSKVLSADKQFRYRLVYYALKNIRLYFSSDSMNSLSAQDVVQIVLEKILLGLRKWNKVLVPDIKTLLFLSVKSFIRNEKHRVSNARFVDIELLDNQISYDPINTIFDDLHPGEIIDESLSSDVRLLISKLKASLKEDIFASFVLDEILEGVSSNIEIARNLGLPIKDVENAKKRIRNKSNKLIKK